MFRKINYCLMLLGAIISLNGCDNKDSIDVTDIISNNEVAVTIKENSYSFALNANELTNLYDNSITFSKQNLNISIAVNSWAGGYVQLRVLSGDSTIYLKAANGITAINEQISGTPDKIKVECSNFTGQTAISVKAQ